MTTKHQRKNYTQNTTKHNKIDGRTQNPKTSTKCSPCTSSKNKKDKNLIDTSCISDYKCAIKLGLEAGLEWFHNYNSLDFADIGGPNEGTMVDENENNNNGNNNNNHHPLSIDLDGNLLGITTRKDGTLPGYDYLLGEWELSKKQHNGYNVYSMNDKFRRNLKLYIFGRSGKERRWLVGNDITKDGAFIYSPMDPQSPIEIGHGWVHYDNSAQSWLPLKDFRFTPLNSVKPQIQQMIPKNGGKNIEFDANIQFMFTHKIRFKKGDKAGYVEICYKNLNRNDLPNDIIFEKDPFLHNFNDNIEAKCAQLNFEHSSSRGVLYIEGDMLQIDFNAFITKVLKVNRNELVNSIVTISITRDLVESDSDDGESANIKDISGMYGNDECFNCLMFLTTKSDVNLNLIASQYFDRAYVLAREMHKKNENKNKNNNNNDDDDNDDNSSNSNKNDNKSIQKTDEMFEALLLNALLYNSDDASREKFLQYSDDKEQNKQNIKNEYDRDNTPFIFYYELLSEVLDAYSTYERENTDNDFITRSSEHYLIDGYMKLFSNPKMAVNTIDKALKNCYQDYYNVTLEGMHAFCFLFSAFCLVFFLIQYFV